MTIFDECVHSVARRGFYSLDNPANKLGLLQAQYIRLVEEVGEIGRALRKGDLLAAGTETADAVIVCANLFEVLGIEMRLDRQDWVLADTIQDKLRADEARGYLHGGGRADPVLETRE